MKRLCLFIMGIALVAFAGTAFSATVISKTPFSNVSGASAAVKTSAVYNVIGYRTKTIHISGVTLGSSPTSVTFKNMSGTLIVEGAPSTTGPWSTCIANDYGQTAVSKTTNGSMTWADTTPYIRVKWTSGTVGGKLGAWLLYMND